MGQSSWGSQAFLAMKQRQSMHHVPCRCSHGLQWLMRSSCSDSSTVLKPDAAKLAIAVAKEAAASSRLAGDSGADSSSGCGQRLLISDIIRIQVSDSRRGGFELRELLVNRNGRSGSGRQCNARLPGRKRNYFIATETNSSDPFLTRYCRWIPGSRRYIYRSRRRHARPRI